MLFKDLREFLKYLENNGHLKRITHPISTYLEITEVSQRFLKLQGPALLFENPVDHRGIKLNYPVLTNLYAHPQRIAWALGLCDKIELQKLGELIAFFRQPTPPSNFKETLSLLPLAKKAIMASPKIIKKASCQEIVITKPDLNILPIQTCWPGDVAPLITWPLIITKGPSDEKIDNYNVGIYRMQYVSHNKLIMRWLKMRGGEQQYSRWKASSINSFPAAAVIGASPAVTMAGVMPIPDNISEYNFAGILTNQKTRLVKCITNELLVPADAEIVIEGEVSLDEYLPEGPFGDHTGYYNEVESFPVFNVKAITMRQNPIYLSTYTGKPPDEPSILGEALNEIFTPIIKQQFPEIVDFWLPPEGCSYRFANVAIKKTYPGQAKKIMMGVWSFLRQFMYTKFIIVLDDDINIREWKEVIWAISTRCDPSRDLTIINNTPIDYLDFASIESGLGGKVGIDATNKISPEISRKWGEKIKMSPDVEAKIDKIWEEINGK